MDDLVKRYITYPLAITVFKQDIEKFKHFKMGNIYLDLLESIIERMTKDYYDLKAEMLAKHHIDIKKLGKGKYQVNKEIMEFTSGELKDMTRELMSEYIESTKKFERKDRGWER